MRSARRARRFAGRASVALLALLTACAQHASQDTLHNVAGPVARKELHLFTPVFWIAAVIFFLVEGALVFATIRFRSRSDRDFPVQIHGNTFLEVTWTIIPAVILLAVSIPTVATIFSLAKVPVGPNVVRVNVTGHQWWWEYNYPDLGVTTANELHIPVGKQIAIQLRSVDVIHSFWVPPLGGKQDVVPGRVNTLTLEADRTGTFMGQCAEYCGLSHANMRLRVMAMTPTEFDTWVAKQKADADIKPADSQAARGAAIFAKTCITCHTIRGFSAGGHIGPDLTHLFSRTTFAGATFELNHDMLMRWVSDSPSLKPGSDMPSALKTLGLTPDDVQAVVAFLETLR